MFMLKSIVFCPRILSITPRSPKGFVYFLFIIIQIIFCCGIRCRFRFFGGDISSTVGGGVKTDGAKVYVAVTVVMGEEGALDLLVVALREFYLPED